jgi:pimeloyl-ACP methyl ester carboxylesterase
MLATRSAEEDEMNKATSADGTTIAYEEWGNGPLVVIVGGAFNSRETWAGLAQELAKDFKVVSYDRRGRGDSGDTQPYAVERELEDLAAVITAARPEEKAFAHGVSSGGALLLRGAKAGLPISRVSVFEPPFRIESAPPVPENYIATLRAFVEADDRAGLVEYFQTQVVGLPLEMLEPMKGSPMWDGLLAMAPTLVYDGLALGGDDQSLPVDMLGDLRVPVLAVSSDNTTPWLREVAIATAEAAPAGRHQGLAGGFHDVSPPVLAAALTAFYTEDG